MRSLGIDVGVAKGLDLVLLDETRVPLEMYRRVDVRSVGAIIRTSIPDVVAIDSPPAWASGDRARRTEREIRRLGIQCFGTPPEDRGARHPFYAWMRTGFEVFRAAEREGFPRYRSGSPKGRAIEVFPHASAVALASCLPPRGSKKYRWRASVLATNRVDVAGLRGPDQVDAALAALTGLAALDSRFSAPGDPDEGVIVMPIMELPERPYRRCRPEPPAEDQPRLRGTTPCACGDPGCRRTTTREFAPGHDAKRKSMLWRRARLGQDAVDELRRRGWVLPPEMR